MTLVCKANGNIVRLTKRPSKERYTRCGFRTVTVKQPLSFKLFALAAALCFLLLPFLVMSAIRTDARLAEWWVTHIQAGWERFAGTLTSWLPVSVLELCIVTLIIVGACLLVRLVVNLCNARLKKIALGALLIGVGGAIVLDMFTMSMGFGYYRAPMPLAQAGIDYTAAQAAEAARYFLSDYNALAESFERDENGCVECPYTFSELAELIRAEYDKLDDPYFASYTPTAKPIVNSWFLSDVMITGITFLPIGEACLNVAAPPSTVPDTLAHELAHTKGVQREGDANLLAQYILLSSDNDYLRYCGYLDAFGNLLSAVLLAGDRDEYSRLALDMSPLIAAERAYTREYWAAHSDIMGQIGEFFNNAYLKSNGAVNGTGSYDEGKKSEVITPIDPETGLPEIDPDTGKPVVIPVYSQLQKIFFHIYENRVGAPKTAA